MDGHGRSSSKRRLKPKERFSPGQADELPVGCNSFERQQEEKVSLSKIRLD
jgi:hypothetical protein